MERCIKDDAQVEKKSSRDERVEMKIGQNRSTLPLKIRGWSYGNGEKKTLFFFRLLLAATYVLSTGRLVCLPAIQRDPLKISSAEGIENMFRRKFCAFSLFSRS